MTCQMLMSIRVDSKEGLIEHVYKHFDEVKAVQEAYKGKIKSPQYLNVL